MGKCICKTKGFFPPRPLNEEKPPQDLTWGGYYFPSFIKWSADATSAVMP